MLNKVIIRNNNYSCNYDGFMKKNNIEKQFQSCKDFNRKLSLKWLMKFDTTCVRDFIDHLVPKACAY